MTLLGAVLFGTVGLSVGSWYGGRGVTPPSLDQARSVAAEVLPDEVPLDSDQVVRGSRFHVDFAADDLGSVGWTSGTSTATTARSRRSRSPTGRSPSRLPRRGEVDRQAPGSVLRKVRR